MESHVRFEQQTCLEMHGPSMPSNMPSITCLVLLAFLLAFRSVFCRQQGMLSFHVNHENEADENSGPIHSIIFKYVQSISFSIRVKTWEGHNLSMYVPYSLRLLRKAQNNCDVSIGSLVFKQCVGCGSWNAPNQSKSHEVMWHHLISWDIIGNHHPNLGILGWCILQKNVFQLVSSQLILHSFWNFCPSKIWDP